MEQKANVVTMAKDERCSNCGANIAKGHLHSYLCPQLTEEEKSKNFEEYITRWKETANIANKHAMKLHKMMIHWQGKYLIVKQENNALRRKKKKLDDALDCYIQEMKNKYYSFDDIDLVVKGWDACLAAMQGKKR